MGGHFGSKEEQAASIPQTRTAKDLQLATPSTRPMSTTTSVTKIGPYGGLGGNAWDIYTKPKTLVSVQVWSDDNECGVINGLSFTYVDEAGTTKTSGPWGSTTGRPHVINLSDNESINSVFGTTNGNFITSLKFVTNKGAIHGPFGAHSEYGLSTFSFPATTIGFFGSSSEKFINAIGAYKLNEK